MPPSWMIKLTEGWGEPKKDAEGDYDGFKKEEGEGMGREKSDSRVGDGQVQSH